MPSPPASCPNAADAARACTQSCAAGHRNDLPWRVHGPPAPQEQPAQPAASCCGPLAPWTARPPAHPPARRPPACPPTLPTGTLCRGWRDRANGTVPPVFWRGPVHINVRNFGAVPYMLIWTSCFLSQGCHGRDKNEFASCYRVQACALLSLTIGRRDDG